jgi:Bacterial PH domain
MWRQSRLQVVVHDTGLHVVNYLSTFRVPWDSIERFDSFFGYWGIRVMMKDGRTNRHAQCNPEADHRRLAASTHSCRQDCERTERAPGALEAVSADRPCQACDHAL